jgi:transposase
VELTDPGFDYSVLSEFRARLIEKGWEQKAFDKILAYALSAGYLKKRGQQRTDSTHVVGAVRELNRLEMVGETMRHTLDSLAVVVPDWTRAHSQAERLERHGRKVQNYWLPKSQTQRDEYPPHQTVTVRSTLNNWPFRRRENVKKRKHISSNMHAALG